MHTINMEVISRINWLGYVEYKNPWIHFKRILDEYVLYIIKSGELHIEENGVRYSLKRGDMLLLEPGFHHEGFEEQTCDYYYVHFSHPDIRSLPQDTNLQELAERMMIENHDDHHLQENDICIFPKQYAITSQSTFHYTLHTLNELQQLYKRKHFNRSKIAIKFTELINELSKDYIMSALKREYGGSTKPLLRVHAVVDYIHQHYPAKITSETIESEFECNYDYLNRIFNAITGYSIIHYVNLVRMNRAKELLEATHLSIGEIGYLVGLNDPYYFSKLFKKYAGLSPLQYHKQYKERSRS